MFDDDLEPQKKSKTLKNLEFQNLEPMSLDEIESYIVELKNEIKRSEDEIERKKAHHAAAGSIFK